VRAGGLAETVASHGREALLPGARTRLRVAVGLPCRVRECSGCGCRAMTVPEEGCHGHLSLVPRQRRQVMH
jgi:hypothetical protein